MEMFFTPGIRLLNSLGYPQKFILIGISFLLPLLVMGYFLIQESNDRILFIQAERQGIEHLRLLRGSLDHLQQHRGMSAALIKGDQSFTEPLRQRQKDIDSSLGQLAELDRHLGDLLGVGHRLAALKAGWERLKSELGGLGMEQSFVRHVSLIAEVRDAITQVAIGSRLVLTSQLESYFMSSLLVERLPALTEGMGQARAIGAGIAATGQFTPESWAELMMRVDRIQEAEKAMKHGLDLIMQDNPLLQKRLQGHRVAAEEAIDRYLGILQPMLQQKEIKATAAGIFAQSTEAINAVYGLFDVLIPLLDETLAKEMAEYEDIQILTLAMMVATLLVMGYLFAAFYLAVLHSINRLKSGIGAIASGDLTLNIQLSTRDELSWIADQVNAMREHFRALVSKVVGCAHKVTDSADALSTQTDAASQGVNEQLSQTEQVATAVHEMSATVQEVARSASATAEATNTARKEADAGHVLVQETVATIRGLAVEIQGAAVAVQNLSEESKEVSKVLDVIRGIAEQTNLLALNAAIEAARAGDQGRGFAVVADEVRALASRSQQATGEIQSMIERLQAGAKNAVKAMADSGGKTEESVAMAERAGAVLTAITESVAIITDMSAQIASAAEEQSVVADDISRNLSRIAQISDQNAAVSAHNSSSCNDLVFMAEELGGMVAVFRV